MAKEVYAHHSPYPMIIATPDGVKDCVQSLKEGFKNAGETLRTIAPKKGKTPDNQADFYVGTTLPTIHHGNTAYRPSVIVDTQEAKKVLSQLHPAVMVLHEPLVPDAGRSLIKIATEEIEEKFPVIGQFHARSDRLGKALKIVDFLHKHGMLAWYTDAIFKRLNGRIAVSRATAEFWDGYFPGDYEIIHNGINLDEFNPNIPVIQEWLKDDKPVMFLTGRDDPRKRKLDGLLAYKNLRENGVPLKLKIAGLEQENSELRKKVREKQIPDVEFLGNLPGEMYRRAMRTADIYVACSDGNEGTNRTILDAQAVGTLVVATNIKGHDEAYGGFLPMPKPRNVEGIENAIFQRLYLPPGKKQEELKRARGHVEDQFDVKKIVQEHLAFYEKCRFESTKPDRKVSISSPHGIIFSKKS